MAYRLTVHGVLVEADSPADVASLLKAIGGGQRERRATTPTVRGASNGALEGRVVDALAGGPMKPAALVETCKADRYSLRRALVALEQRGLVRSSGMTISRMYALSKKGRNGHG